jgi:hypothetical protein
VWTPSKGSWQVLQAWPGSGYAHRAVQLTTGEVLVLRTSTTAERVASLWDPATGRLASIDPPSAGLEYSTLTSLPDGLALHVGAPRPELWSPGERRWISLLAPRGSPLRNHVAVRLADGDVLIAGGDQPATRVDRHNAWMLGVGALGILALLAGAVVAIRARRPSAGALVAAVVSACAAAGVLLAILSFISAIAGMD